MSNPNQFNSPQNPSGPRQVPPSVPPSTTTPPTRAPTPSRPPDTSTRSMGSPTRRSAPRHPTATAAHIRASPTPRPTKRPLPPTQQKRRSLATTILTVLTFLAIVIYAVVGGSYDFGTERLTWTAVASGLGLIVAIGCLVSIPRSFQELRRAKAAGDIATSRMRIRALSFAIIILPVSGYFSVTYGVPAAQDLVEGHHTVTVTSCTYEQGSHRRSRRRGGGRTVYDNYFTMTLTDGTLHTTTIETDQPTSIQTMGGTYEVLYQACKVQSGNASMTLDVYSHSWIIVDAQIE